MSARRLSNTPPAPTSEELTQQATCHVRTFIQGILNFIVLQITSSHCAVNQGKFFCFFFLRHFTLLHKKNYLHYSLKYVISILYLYLKKQFLSFQYERTWLAIAALNRSRSSIIIISLGSRFQSTIVRGKKLNL